MPGQQTEITGANYTAYESLTISTTAVALTAATVSGLTYALITNEAGAVRFRLDGTAPTASVGHVMLDGDSLVLNSAHELVNAQFISRDGVTATLRCSYGN